MNILNIEHISKIYGEKVIFDDVSLGIHSGDKIGVIGVNGTGKTTLLKIIAKINEPDKGQIICGNGIRVSYLPQNPEFPKKQSILEYVMDGKEHQDWKTEQRRSLQNLESMILTKDAIIYPEVRRRELHLQEL